MTVAVGDAVAEVDEEPPALPAEDTGDCETVGPTELAEPDPLMEDMELAGATEDERTELNADDVVAEGAEEPLEGTTEDCEDIDKLCEDVRDKDGAEDDIKPIELEDDVAMLLKLEDVMPVKLNDEL